jgi:transcriptional regulator with AAA-type ATPase domain
VLYELAGGRTLHVPGGSGVSRLAKPGLRFVITGGDPRDLPAARFRIAPLRERREDVPALVVELLRRRGVIVDRAPPWVEELLGASAWRGNVRELEGIVQRVLEPLERWAWEAAIP